MELFAILMGYILSVGLSRPAEIPGSEARSPKDHTTTFGVTGR